MKYAPGRILEPMQTSTTIVQLNNPVQYGANQTLRATVSSVSGIPNEGTVNFYVNGNFVGSSTVANGIADLNLGSGGYNVGTLPISADYLGTTRWKASSGTGSMTVNQATTTTAVPTDNIDTTKYGQGWNLTVNVGSSTGATPTGNVRIFRNNAIYGDYALSGGSVTVGISGTDTGVTVLPVSVNWSAQFLGSTNFAASAQSGDQSHTVNKQNSAVELPLETPDPGNINQPTVFTGSCGFEYVIQTSGTVRLWDDSTNTVLTTATPDGSGNYSLSYQFPASGSYTQLRVDYTGTDQTNSSTTTQFTHDVV